MSLWGFLFGPRGKYSREGTLTLLDRQTVEAAWVKIEEQVVLGKPANFRSAVIEADKLVDFVLRKQYPGEETLGERLKAAKPKFIGNYPIYDGLWFAHKVRNELVHNVGFEVPSVEVRSTLDKYKTALVHLGALR